MEKEENEKPYLIFNIKLNLDNKLARVGHILSGNTVLAVKGRMKQ